MKGFTVRMLIACVVVLLLGLIALAVAGDTAAGKTVFTNRCKMCHGADGAGNPAMARMLKVEFYAMDSDHVQKQADAELKQIISKGKGKMAAVRGLSDRELDDVIAYIRSLKKEK